MSLSRTYRPQTFAELTDQDPIKETLRAEIETGKLGNAYLFAGPRGVGKTTLARVFAKALNCLNPKKGEPCNECASCTETNAGRALDVIEMDAASNTGVDNIREAIVEHVRFTPTSRKYKIYVLDEAHMLSTSAWNALLKTIEEPPAYAKFIFVTTELHKVPATIQSRCQRFDFKRIGVDALAARVKELAKKEGVKIDEDVVRSIAAKSDGCVRDAETFLGQLISLGEKNITVDIASLVLPVSRLPLAAQLLATWGTRQLGPSLDRVREMEEQGIPFITLFDDLIHAVRELLIASDSPDDLKRLSAGDDGDQAIAKLTTVYRPEELSDMALLFMERRRDAKQGADARFCMELCATAVALGILPHGTSERRQNDPPMPQPPSDKLPKADKPVSETPPAPAPRTERSAGTSLSVGQLVAKWPAFLRAVDEKSKSLTFILKIARPVSFDGSTYVIEFQYPFHRDKTLNDLKTRTMLETCMQNALGVEKVRFEGVIGAESAEAKQSRTEDTTSMIMKAFGGQLVEEGGSQTA